MQQKKLDVIFSGLDICQGCGYEHLKIAPTYEIYAAEEPIERSNEYIARCEHFKYCKNAVERFRERTEEIFNYKVLKKRQKEE